MAGTARAEATAPIEAEGSWGSAPSSDRDPSPGALSEGASGAASDAAPGIPPSESPLEAESGAIDRATAAAAAGPGAARKTATASEEAMSLTATG